MLDPFSCLAVATAVVQFIDFTGKFCLILKETYLVGSTKGNEDIGFLTKDIIDLLERLKKDASLNNSAQLRGDDKILFDLVTKCIATGDELQARLKRLNPNPSTAQNKIRRSLRQAVKVMWHQGDIASLEARLQKYRQQIDSHILVILRKIQYQDQDERRSQIDMLSQDHKKVIDQLDKHFDFAISKLQTLETKLEKQEEHNRVLINSVSKELSKLSKLLQDATLVSKALQNPAQVTKNQHATSLVMQALYYHRSHERLRSVEKSHRDTFYWIFKPLKFSDYSKNNEQDFLTWLVRGSGCFWISGKAGSGKSTLMRFICDSQQVVDSLCHWSQGHNLVTATFFFWRAGSDLQNSLHGMLQAILYEVLQVYPELTAALLPDFYKSITVSNSSSACLTLLELQEAFESLAGIAENGYAAVQPFKLCLFVDGIDEFTGEPTVIAELFQEITRYCSIKIVVSGRPDQCCEVVFEDSSKLRVQDYTLSDIRKYVEDRFAADKRVRRLVDEEKTAIQDLIREIIRRADGVFLWVVLVVKSLLEGVRHADNASELYRRFNQLPRDLQDLYDHILKGLRPEYRIEACRLFVFYRAYAEAFTDIELNPLCLRPLTMGSDDYQAWLSQDWQGLSDRLELLSIKFEERLRSRTKGLLEVRRTGVEDSFASCQWTVQLLHKTLAEFLYDPQQWKRIVQQAQVEKFDTEVQLCRALLVRQKQLLVGSDRQEWTPAMRWNPAITLLRRIQKFEAGKPFDHVHITTSLLKMLLDQSCQSPFSEQLCGYSTDRLLWLSGQGLALAFGFSGHVHKTATQSNLWTVLCHALGWLCCADSAGESLRQKLFKYSSSIPEEVFVFTEIKRDWIGDPAAYHRICLRVLRSHRSFTDDELGKLWALVLIVYQATKSPTLWDDIVMQLVQMGADLSQELSESSPQLAFDVLPQHIRSQIPKEHHPSSDTKIVQRVLEEQEKEEIDDKGEEEEEVSEEEVSEQEEEEGGEEEAEEEEEEEEEEKEKEEGWTRIDGNDIYSYDRDMEREELCRLTQLRLMKIGTYTRLLDSLGRELLGL